MLAVSNNGLVLVEASKRLKNDFEVVLASVNNDGYSL
ncbi:MAG: DUF4116 domain-containing protein [bacterium]